MKKKGKFATAVAESRPLGRIPKAFQKIFVTHALLFTKTLSVASDKPGRREDLRSCLAFLLAIDINIVAMLNYYYEN